MQGKLVPQDPNYEPASVLLEKIKAAKERLVKEKKIKKQNPLPSIKGEEIPFEIPENWVWCRLGDIFNFIDYRGKTPTKTLVGVRLISAKNIRFGYIDNDPVEFIAENQYSKWMVRGFPKNGDLLFVTEGHTMGFVAQINLDFKYVLAQRTICLQPHTYDYPNCLFYFLMSPDFQKVVKKNATGAAATGIKSAKLKEMIIPLPPLSEQQRIVAKLDELMQFCDNLESSIKESQNQNEQLLKQVLTEALGIKIDKAEVKKKDLKTEKKTSKFDPNTTLMEIEELLKKHGKLHAEELWKMSNYPEDIDAFYAELKKQIEVNNTVKESSEKGYLELV